MRLSVNADDGTIWKGTKQDAEYDDLHAILRCSGWGVISFYGAGSIRVFRRLIAGQKAAGPPFLPLI